MFTSLALNFRGCNTPFVSFDSSSCTADATSQLRRLYLSGCDANWHFLSVGTLYGSRISAVGVSAPRSTANLKTHCSYCQRVPASGRSLSPLFTCPCPAKARHGSFPFPFLPTSSSHQTTSPSPSTSSAVSCPSLHTFTLAPTVSFFNTPTILRSLTTFLSRGDPGSHPPLAALNFQLDAPPGAILLESHHD